MSSIAFSGIKVVTSESPEEVAEEVRTLGELGWNLAGPVQRSDATYSFSGGGSMYTYYTATLVWPKR